MSLTIRNITFSYGKSAILNGVDLTISPGQFVALLGANGSGKSTLMKSICGVLSPDGGSIDVDGDDVLAMSAKARATRIAYVPQSMDASELGLAVHEIVAQGVQRPGLKIARTALNKMTVQAMREVEVTRHAFAKINTLSGGERQRVFIGRALAMKTDYLLLDEPVSALDLKYQARIMGLLKALADKGKGVVAIVHDLNLAATFADTVALLDHGRIVAHTDPSTAFDPDLLSQVYDTQVRVVHIDGCPVVLPGQG